MIRIKCMNSEGFGEFQEEEALENKHKTEITRKKQSWTIRSISISTYNHNTVTLSHAHQTSSQVLTSLLKSQELTKSSGLIVSSIRKLNCWETWRSVTLKTELVQSKQSNKEEDSTKNLKKINAKQGCHNSNSCTCQFGMILMHGRTSIIPCYSSSCNSFVK